MRCEKKTMQMMSFLLLEVQAISQLSMYYKCFIFGSHADRVKKKNNQIYWH